MGSFCSCVGACLRFRCSGACSPRTRLSWCWPSPGLVFAPVTVSVPVGASELLVLAVGLVVLLIADLVLLRPAFAPLDIWPRPCARHDPLAPGPRAEVRGGPVVVALAQTFNDMLDRLESERRESARQALMVQEAERRRIARELHDEVGQTLTGVMLQIEGLAPSIPGRASRSAWTSCARPRDTGPRRCAGSRAGFARTRWRSWGCRALWPLWRARSSGKRVIPVVRRLDFGAAGHAGRGAGDLPGRAGGVDECRAPCRGDVGPGWSCATRRTGSS